MAHEPNHLHDEELEVEEVPRVLARLGPRARAALPALIGLVKKGSDDIHLMTALVEIDPEGTECVTVLVEAMKSEDAGVANAAARYLGLLGPRAKGALPTLAKILTCEVEEDAGGGPYPQVSAAKALRRIGPEAESAIPALIRTLRDPRIAGLAVGAGEKRRGDIDCSTAIAAAEALGSLGPEAKAAVPALIGIVRSSDEDSRCASLSRAAILALGQIRPEARAAVPILRDLMQEDEKKDRCQPEVVIALYQLAPDGKDIAEKWLEKPVIYEAQRGIGLGMEDRAMVLGAMGRTSFETDWMTRRYLERIDWMIALFDPGDEFDDEFTEEWFETIGSFGTAARVAIPRLNEFREHPNPWIRLWAKEALGRIAPAGPGKVH